MNILRRIVLVLCLLAGALVISAASAQDDAPETIELVLIPDLPSEELDSVLQESILEAARIRVLAWHFRLIDASWTEDNRLALSIDANFDRDVEALAAAFDNPVRVLVGDLAAPDMLLEFVDFSAIQFGQIPDHTCLLTTAQVEQALRDLGENDELPAYTKYTCDGDEPAQLQDDGTPFVTIMTGDGIADATAEYKPYGWAVNFTLDMDDNSVGALLDFITNNADRLMALVLDGRVLSAPVIQYDLAALARAGEMTSGVITGNFTESEARDLAESLRVHNTRAIQLAIESITVPDAAPVE